MQGRDTRRGTALMIGTTAVFAVQDALSRHLAAEYSVFLVVMIRYWFFALFVAALAARAPGGLRGAARSARPGLQVARGLLLAAEICVMVGAFVLLGLADAHAVFVVYPLIAAALAGPVLGERVGPRRWAAIGVGFAGVLVILAPGAGVFGAAALVPLLAAGMFALYGLLTRLVAERDEAATSFFYTGVAGAVLTTAVGVWHWEAMSAPDYGWMAMLCLTGAGGHWLLIKCYEAAEASAVQPFAYLQLPFAAGLGVLVFGEAVEPRVALGAGIVVAAGLFAWARERRAARGA